MKKGFIVLEKKLSSPLDSAIITDGLGWPDGLSFEIRLGIDGGKRSVIQFGGKDFAQVTHAEGEFDKVFVLHMRWSRTTLSMARKPLCIK